MKDEDNDWILLSFSSSTSSNTIRDNKPLEIVVSKFDDKFIFFRLFEHAANVSSNKNEILLLLKLISEILDKVIKAFSSTYLIPSFVSFNFSKW